MKVPGYKIILEPSCGDYPTPRLGRLDRVNVTPRGNRLVVLSILHQGWVGWIVRVQGHRGKIRAPGQRRHGPSHIEQSRAHIMLTMLTLGALPGPAGPCRAPKSRRAPGILPPLPPPSRRACASVTPRVNRLVVLSILHQGWVGWIVRVLHRG